MALTPFAVDTGMYEALFGQAAELGSGRMFRSSIDRARGPTRSAFTANSDVGGTFVLLPS